MEEERLQKIIAQAGILSRRKAEELIAQGRVTSNGKIAVLGDRAVPGKDEIAIDGIVVGPSQEYRYFVLNKPTGVISTTSDERGRKTVLDFLDEKTASSVRLFPVGRLDMNSSGLIILTNDGFLANRLIHPRFSVPRRYLVEVEPVPKETHIEALLEGIQLEGGISIFDEVSLEDIQGNRGQLKVTLTTGKKRQIRRSFKSLGYDVISLCRVSIGGLSLGSLKPGEYRELSTNEVQSLYRATGL